MEITPQQLKEIEKRLLENQKVAKEFNEKEKKYRKEIDDEEFELNILWQDNVNKIDKDFLLSKCDLVGFDNFEENFTVVFLNLNKVLKYYLGKDKLVSQTYPDNKLFDNVQNDRKMTKLISYVKDGNTLCPPVIGFEFVPPSNDEIFSIYDGNHRIALSRYMKIESIPFVVRKDTVERIKSLTLL